MHHNSTTRRTFLTQLAGCAMLSIPGERSWASRSSPRPFDSSYSEYADLLSAVVRGGRVDYRTLMARRSQLAALVASFDGISPSQHSAWTVASRVAFWLNAYNVFTLQSVVEHYPIRPRPFVWAPANSIKQIPRVWTNPRWRALGSVVSLDHIEHSILRHPPTEPRVHAALNCASASCPALRTEPYVGVRLDEQLSDAMQQWLGSARGCQRRGHVLAVSRIFKWFGADFVPQYAELGPAARPRLDRTILGVLAVHGPASIRDVLDSPATRIAYLDYDWSLNDTGSQRVGDRSRGGCTDRKPAGATVSPDVEPCDDAQHADAGADRAPNRA